jgi:sRNA-binding regulator protein Hfq
MESTNSSSNDRYPPVSLHVAELIKYRDEQRPLRLTLVNGAAVEGIVQWFDEDTLHLKDQSGNEMTLFKRALASYQPT